MPVIFRDEQKMKCAFTYDNMEVVTVNDEPPVYGLAISTGGKEIVLGYNSNLDNLLMEMDYAISLVEKGENSTFVFTNELASERCATLVPKIAYSKEAIAEWVREQVNELTYGNGCIEFKPDSYGLKQVLDEYKTQYGINPYIAPPEGELDTIFGSSGNRKEFIENFQTAIANGEDLTPLQDAIWTKQENKLVERVSDALYNEMKRITQIILSRVEEMGAEFQEEFANNFDVKTRYNNSLVINDWKQFGIEEISRITDETRAAIHEYVNQERYGTHILGLELKQLSERLDFSHSLSSMITDPVFADFSPEASSRKFASYMNTSMFVDFIHQQGCLVADVADNYLDIKANGLQAGTTLSFEEAYAKAMVSYGDAFVTSNDGQNAEIFVASLHANLDDIYKIQTMLVNTEKELKEKGEVSIVLPVGTQYAIERKDDYNKINGGVQQFPAYFLPADRPFVIQSSDVRGIAVDVTKEKYHDWQALDNIMKQPISNSATLSVVPKDSPEIETAKTGSVKSENFNALYEKLTEQEPKVD